MKHWGRHSPQGECGLKYVVLEKQRRTCESLPARGVRVEITSQVPRRPLPASLPARGVRVEIRRLRPRLQPMPSSLPARGVRVEILMPVSTISLSTCHSPQGECGLKFHVRHACHIDASSLPARGVRVEIPPDWLPSQRHRSLPARGVRVEIPPLRPDTACGTVTPRKGSAG